MNLLKIFLAAFLIDNVILMRFLALCSYIGMTANIGQSVGMGFAVTFVTVLSTIATYPIYHLVLVPLHIEFLKILVFIIVIASLVQLVEFYLKKNVPGLYTAMGIYLPLITTNCAILAITFDNISKGHTFIEAVVYSVGAAFGYMISMILLAGVRAGTRNSPIPAFLRGTPILFVATSLIAMAFMGFSGLIK